MTDIKPTDRILYDLHMYQVDFNEEKIKELKGKIANKYGVPLKNVSINFTPITINEKGEQISIASEIIDNIQDPSFQVELFKEYIKNKEITDVDFDEIIAIDNKINAYIDYDQYSKYKSYKFKYVKWSNYLSYGPDNYFDFTKLHGLVLLKGQPENQCGKTTFAIDLLRFALFGKAEKSPTLDSVFNIYLPETTEVIVEAGIEIEGVDYIIRRTVTRPALKKRTEKSKCKQKLEYYKSTENGMEIISNCEGENTAETNSVIRECVGNVDDFNLVISATSYTLMDLLRMGNTDKGKVFSRWLGLLSIEKKEEIAKKLWKENITPSLLSKKYDINVLKREVEDFKTCIENCESEIKNLENSINQLTKDIDTNTKDRDNVIDKRKAIKKELEKIDITTLENQIDLKNNELTAKRGEFKVLKEQYMLVKDSVFDLEVYEKTLKLLDEKKKKKSEYELSNAEIKTKISVLKEDNNRIIKLMEGGICPTCGQKIDADLQNDNINTNNNKINGLIANGTANKKEIDKIDAELNKINNDINNMEIKRNEVNEKQKLELKLTALKTNIENIKLTLDTMTRQKKDIEENKESIRYNNEIDLKVNNYNITIQTLTNTKNTKTTEIATQQGNIKYYNLEISKRNDIISKIAEEDKIVKNWTLYQELVGKNGIIKVVLKKALPIINNEVARILDGLCDFEVKLDIDEKNNVAIDLIRDGQSLDMGICASGFEGTFASLALRSALAGISSISRPNFLCLDEVDSTISSARYDKLTELYKRILSNYQFIIHIVHNELLTDIHDMVISVVKEGNVSKIL